LSGDIGTIGDSTDNTQNLVTIGSGVKDNFIHGFIFTKAYDSGILIDGTNSNINCCVFTNTYGRGINILNGNNVKINASVFFKIIGVAGVGVYIETGCLDVIITNSVFAENTMTFGGSIYSENNNAIYSNCTIVNNICKDGNPAGIFNWNNPTDRVMSCIIYNNRNSNGREYAQLTYGYYVSYSDIEDKDSNGIYSITGDTINLIDGSPVFEYQKDSVNLYPAGADGIWYTIDDGLRLQSVSPCREKGNFYSDFDILGRTRPNENYPDIGAYEYYQ